MYSKCHSLKADFQKVSKASEIVKHCWLTGLLSTFTTWSTSMRRTVCIKILHWVLHTHTKRQGPRPIETPIDMDKENATRRRLWAAKPSRNVLAYKGLRYMAALTMNEDAEKNKLIFHEFRVHEAWGLYCWATHSFNDRMTPAVSFFTDFNGGIHRRRGLEDGDHQGAPKSGKWYF